MKILYFGAEHCGQCKVLKPNFINECQRLSLKEGKDYEFIDAEENIEMSQRYGIRNLPTLIFINENQEPIDRSVGVTAWQSIEQHFIKN